jgi:hypothetical protein
VATAAAVTVLADLTAGLAALVAEVSELRGEMTAFMTELRAMRTAELAALPPAGPAADVTPGESAVTTELRAMGTDLAAAAAAEPVAASVSEVTAAMRRELALQGDQEHGTGHGGRQQWQWDEGTWSWHESPDQDRHWDGTWRKEHHGTEDQWRR